MAEYETNRVDAAGRPVVERTTTDRATIVDRPVERRSNGLGWLVALLVLAALVWAAFHFGLIDADGGKLPKVDVTTSGGEAPSVTTGSLAVGTKETTVDVPTVGTKKEVIDVPVVGVKKAEEAN